ncbi:MAG TPA: carboxypeptidase regulatory-like domain-containing protein [Pirellulales bacterium]|nr:carboxypeptidase regulatory-like domain-containing protein [Pirellulales bacterium]
MRRSTWLGLILLAALMGIGAVLWQRSGAKPPRALQETMPASQPARPTLAGRVQAQGEPVAAALVRIQGRSASTLTDDAGRFALARPRAIAGEFTLTASKAGYFIGGRSLSNETDANAIEIELKLLPEQDCARYAWVDPTPDQAARQNCGNCHQEIYDEWKLSAHAAAANNRRFANLYDGRDWQGRPERGWSLLAEHPHGAGVCTSCHAPSLEPNEPAFDDLRGLSGVAAQGVHCDLCHKIRNVSTEHLGLAHGRFALEWLRPEQGQVFFGPLDDVARGEDVYSPLQQSSRFCASCHEGVVFGVPVYTTYSEWFESPARQQGKQCQTCHMAPTGSLTNIAPGAGGVERDPRTLASHRLLPGGREAMLKKCLKLSIEGKDAAAGFEVSVELAARDVGHRVPTGFIDRHLALSAEAFDSEGQALDAVSGPRLPEAAGRSLAQRPGRLFARLLSEPDGRAPAPFWRAGVTFVDTRLAPERPEKSRWTFPPVTRRVRVQLWYRRFWPETVEAKSWPNDEILVLERELRLD